MIRLDLVSPSTLTELVSLLVAFALSSVVGWERARKLKSAGLRTHVLVGIGAALFTLVSAYGFSNVVGDEVVLDPSRIAAQVVSGIGFLGAGMIFVRQNAVNGLTTAASIWVTAAIGMACGAGMILIAVVATALHLVTVLVLSVLSRRLRPGDQDPVVTLRYREGKGALRYALARAAESGFDAILLDMRELERPGKPLRVETRVRLAGSGDHDGLVRLLSDIQGMSSVRLADNDAD